ncbi:hypothetical protein [Streptomyces sp. NPDC047000]|uniref:hypothetical protein n=1 Tax=Streptomyces sp. NPDC047000 TaxID=3155474 RepID=UPI0033F70CB1
MPGIDECLLEAMRLPGARGAALVDWTSGLALGTVGESPGGDHEATATEAAELARLAAEHRCFTSAAAPDTRHHRDDPHDPHPPQLAGHTDPDTPDDPADPPLEDLIISNRDSYHVLRFVGSTFDSSIVLHLWLARTEGNLALARIRLGEMAGRLVLG